MSKRCDVYAEFRAVNGMNMGAGFVVLCCRTHHFEFTASTSTEVPTDRCPLGRIEEAAEAVVASARQWLDAIEKAHGG